jgi:hypothetical protein
MLESPFPAAFLQDHAAGRNSIIAPPESKPASVRNSVANADANPPPLKQQFPNVLRACKVKSCSHSETGRGEKALQKLVALGFSLRYQLVLLFSVNVEAEEPASIEVAPAHPTIEILCVFQHKQILPFTRACCMIMVRAHLAAFSKVVLRPNHR